MKKIIILMVVFFWLCSVSSFALDTFSGVEISMEGNHAVITGTYCEGGENISVMIFPAGRSPLELPQNGILDSDWSYVGMSAANENGSFSLVCEISGASGIYTLNLRGATGELYTKNFIYNEMLNTSVQIHVSKSGSDISGDGSSIAPFASLDKAQLEAAKYLNPMNSDVEIILEEGTYNQTQMINISSSNSGKNGYFYKIIGNGDVRLTFARQLSGWKYDKNGIYYTDINEGENPMSIYENGSIAYKARTPNIVDTKAQYNRVFQTYTDDPNFKFYYKSGDLPSISDISGLQAFVWPGGSNGVYNWSTQFLTISNVDFYNKIITSITKAGYELGTGSRYFIQGAKELLDAPGEFYTDTVNKKIYYMPYDAQNFTTGMVLPLAQDGIYIYGTQADPVKNVVIDGLQISITDYPKKGIRINNGENITVKNCEIKNIGYRGISVEGYSKYNTIIGNLITDTGSDGVSIVGVTGIPDNVSASNVIENNRVDNVGLFDGNAGCIRVYDSAENIIRYNKVSRSPRYGIHLKGMVRSRLIGNTYNGVAVTVDNFRSYQKTKDNIIEFNDVSYTMQDSQDCGSIATWGLNTGNIIRNNFIHDSNIGVVTPNPANSFGFGIYNDEDSDGVLIENNIITRLTSTGGARVSGLVYPRGTGNVIKNNYFINNPDALAVYNYNNTYDNSILENPAGAYNCGNMIFTKNIIENSGTAIYKFEDKWTPRQTLLLADYNLIKNPQNVYTITSSNPSVSAFSDWQSVYGNDISSVFENAQIINAGEDDYRLNPASPAITLGISQINQKDMGLKENFSFKESGKAVSRIFTRMDTETVDAGGTIMPANLQNGMKIYFRDTAGYLHGQSDGTVTVDSLNPSVAQYIGGSIKAIAEGSAQFNITVTYGGASKTISYIVNVEGSCGVYVQDNSGNDIEALSSVPAGTIIRAVTQNITETHLTMLAVYRNNSLAQINVSSHPELTVGDDTGDLTIKAMVWKSWTDLRPLCKEKVYVR